MGHREAELVDCNGEVGDHEKHGTKAGGQLGPGPEVIGKLQACDGPPAHKTNQGNVDGHQVGEGAREVGVQQEITQRGRSSDH